MIRYFRIIRLKLIPEGKLNRYLIYAIGEILLVMIGILLALYVNNKNEDRKEILKGYEIIIEIKENLESNSKQFRQEIELEKEVISSIDIVLSNINEIKTYHDSLDRHFHLCGFWPTSTRESSGYEALKSYGVEIIQSEKLRKEIVGLFEIKYPEISEVVRNSEGYSYSTLVPVFSELFLFNKSSVGQSYIDYEASPFEYGEVLKSKKLRGMLSFWRLLRVIGVELRESAIRENELIVKLIDNELKKR